MKKNGFTLIEILVVTSIVGLLSSTLVPKIGNAIEKTNEAVAKVNQNRQYACEYGIDDLCDSSAGGGGGDSIVHDLGNGLIVTHYPEANISYTLNGNENFTAGLITITDGTETYTIMDRNLGATAAGTGCNYVANGNQYCPYDEVYGYHFQRGNNYGFKPGCDLFGSTNSCQDSTTTDSTQVDTTGYGPGNYYTSSTFITVNGDWSSGQNDNLWGGVSGTVEAMQGPCPEGYHVPSSEEWITLATMLGYDGTLSSTDSLLALDRFINNLLIPIAGRRGYTDARVKRLGRDVKYWSSTAQSAKNVYFVSASPNYNFSPTGIGLKSYGYSVRCFKN